MLSRDIEKRQSQASDIQNVILILQGMPDLPITASMTNLESFSAQIFWNPLFGAITGASVKPTASAT